MVMRFGQKCKLSPRIGPVAYQLELPPDLDRIDDIFHVSISDPSHIVLIEGTEVCPNLSFEEEPTRILDRVVKVFW
ncbi:Chromo domain-containing protein [Gossypium australe]|uniref:Chromo domain-containing protein n=1 Tax=Gossypium australe TaxID=47621 RepID=A0A5B6VM42_9ROSI|nr:Chromo domain-containing protein [Gossypium australe]